MPFMVYCIDDPAAGDLRQRTRAVHLEYMIAHKQHVAYGGPLQSDDGKAVLGSLMVLRFGRREDVEDFLSCEPYSQAGLFAETRIFRIRQMVPEVPAGLLLAELERERATA